MVPARMPFALRDRLGDAGTSALAGLLHEREEAVLTIATERFERRLSEECGRLHHEIQTLGHEMRSDMKLLRSELVAALADTRAHLIKWAFLFWVGQLATVIALFATLR